MSTPVILKAKNSADLLAMIPVLVGFTPKESLVLVAFRGRRTCGVLRIDLPKVRTNTVHKRLASSVIGTMCKIPALDAVVLAVYTDEPIAGTGLPRTLLADVLERRIQQFGFELRDSVCQASDGWGSYLDEVTPDGGHPLSDIHNSPLLNGLDAVADGEWPERVPDAAEPEKQRMRDDVARYRRWLREPGSPFPAQFDEFDDLPPFIDEALDWDAATIDRYGALLLLVVQGAPMRDAVMLQWASDLATGYRLREQAERWIEGQRELNDEDKELGGLMLGIGPRPDVDRIQRGMELLTTLVSRADDELRVAPLCMLAWLNWALGAGSRAGRYVDEASHINPDYGLVEVLNTMLSNGVLPEWAFEAP